MNDEGFRRAVEQALVHLHDYAYLQVCPLSRLLLEQQGDRPVGRTLQRLLQEAIQSLRPGPTVPITSAVWRSYRYLYLRYEQGLAPSEVADELGVSLRQSQRTHMQALRAISSVLAGRRRVREGTAPAADDVAESPAARPSELDRELDRVVEAHPVGLVRVDAAVQSVLETIGPLARNHDVDVEVSLPPVPPVVRIDPAFLRQALVNLLSLLIARGHRSLRVSVIAGEHAVAMRLAAPALPSVPSRPVERSEPPPHGVEHAEAYAVSRRLLAAAGAVLRADEGEDGRLAVHFELPVPRTASILIVDDNPDAAGLLGRYLADYPFDVHLDDGTAALETARVRRPDVIILDLMMPRHDGWELLQQLKHDPATQHVPVIVSSVLKQQELAALLGAAAFVPKPVSRSALLTAVHRCLGQLEPPTREPPAGTA